jgi:hypothetical protein
MPALLPGLTTGTRLFTSVTLNSIITSAKAQIEESARGGKQGKTAENAHEVRLKGVEWHIP